MSVGGSVNGQAKGKLQSLFESRRFWMTVGVGVLSAFNDQIGLNLSTEQLNHIVVAVGLWVLGDSNRRTGDA